MVTRISSLVLDTDSSTLTVNYKSIPGKIRQKTISFKEMQVVEESRKSGLIFRKTHYAVHILRFQTKLFQINRTKDGYSNKQLLEFTKLLKGKGMIVTIVS